MVVLVDHVSIFVDGHFGVVNGPSSPIDEVVAEHELVGLLVAYVGKVETIGFLAQYAIEDDMLHDISQLFRNFLFVLFHQGVA